VRYVCSSSWAVMLSIPPVHLVGSVVNQDVYLAELGDGLLEKSLAVRLVTDITRHLHDLLAGNLYDPRRLLGVRLLLREVGDQDVCPLAGEGKRRRAAYAGVPAGDDRRPALETAAATIGVLGRSRARAASRTLGLGAPALTRAADLADGTVGLGPAECAGLRSY
jgi:hypothetical protein